MESIFVQSYADQSISYKQMKNQSKRNTATTTRGFVSRFAENLAPTNNIHGGSVGGLLFAPPPQSIYFSCPPSFSGFNPNQQVPRQSSQPPLLPLPVSRPYSSLSPPSRTSSPVSKKSNRTRDQSLTPKKSKQPNKKREEPNQGSKPSSYVTSATTAPLGPDPNHLPKDISKVLSPTTSSFLIAGSNNNNKNNTIRIKDLEQFSGMIFTLSPPPSSLPLPKFSVKPKLRCTAEAVDDGATDNLCRLLRLR